MSEFSPERHEQDQKSHTGHILSARKESFCSSRETRLDETVLVVLGRLPIKFSPAPNERSLKFAIANC